MPKLLEFIRNLGVPKDEPVLPKASVSFGVYPLGGGDVLMTRALYDHIVTTMEHGTPAARIALAFRLKNTVESREF